ELLVGNVLPQLMETLITACFENIAICGLRGCISLQILYHCHVIDFKGVTLVELWKRVEEERERIDLLPLDKFTKSWCWDQFLSPSSGQHLEFYLSGSENPKLSADP